MTTPPHAPSETTVSIEHLRELLRSQRRAADRSHADLSAIAARASGEYRRSIEDLRDRSWDAMQDIFEATETVIVAAETFRREADSRVALITAQLTELEVQTAHVNRQTARARALTRETAASLARTRRLVAESEARRRWMPVVSIAAALVGLGLAVAVSTWIRSPRASDPVAAVETPIDPAVIERLTETRREPRPAPESKGDNE